MNTNQRTVETSAGLAAPRIWSGAQLFVLGNALLGTIGVFVNQARADALTETWFRCAFGLAGMTAWMVMRGRARHLLPTRTTVAWILAAASLMILSWSLFFTAIDQLSAGVAIVLCNMHPIWALLLGALCLKESPGKRRMAAAGAAMIGLVLAAGIAEHPTAGIDERAYWVAVALCLVAGFCMACVTIIARRLIGLPAGVLAWWQCAIGAVTLWVWPAQHGWPEWGEPWAWLAGLGIIHTGLAYTLMYSGMARLRTDRIALFQFVYPAVAIVIDWILLGQRLGGLQLTGVAAIAIAIWFAERVPARNPEPGGRG
ncbi:EamA family transporter [Bordetella genomosp. 9]|uniref:EamA family transporter n=1 Tax=Bordetella genomosp. 9 TaxID=1416803 RepID=A0A261R2M5_9BORD|nr:DMT family transporter [Bordetella genomosp. 9]OZI19246.1 EamA family transporter [Bordetella genomosp. 9]